MDFNQSLDYLLRLGHETTAIKFGLENTERLLEALAQPHQAFLKVQIAGTNGKGSTTVMLEAICRAAGIKTGVYTSPHLVNVTERIHIDSRDISSEDFARLTTQVKSVAYQLIESGKLKALPTFYEHLTAMALVAFQEAHVELAILETGLGGRLDSTTAAYAEVVAITPISLDHQEYLGETLAEVAAEKAAIIRPGVTTVIAPQLREVMDVILERCLACSLEPTFVDRNVRVIDRDLRGRISVVFETGTDVYANARINLPGRHQSINAAVAIGIAEALIDRGFEISHEAIIAGLESVEHSGRLEWHEGNPTLLFDGAHNSAGASALRGYLDEFVHVPLTLIFGAMRDKDLSEMAATLFPAATRVFLTEIDNPRSATSEMLKELVRNGPFADRATICASSKEALSAAVEYSGSTGLICVTGSLYLVGEIKALKRQDRYASGAN
jgi:dihydrofolate synthase/folylpolyglutamate synthase